MVLFEFLFFRFFHTQKNQKNFLFFLVVLFLAFSFSFFFFTFFLVRFSKMSEEDNSSPQQGTEINIFHLITDEDELPEDLFQQWIKRNDMGEEGMDYGIVAVLGCQSSGKSTLLNILFETNFQTMEAQFGRSQTTKGIWMGRFDCPLIFVDFC